MKKLTTESDFSIRNKQIADVTVLLNIWKRNHLEEQLSSVLSQTILPKEIWIVHYEDHVKLKSIVDHFKEIYPPIFLIASAKNLKYFGRFSIAINITTKFTWLLDDDVIPGEKWMENCVTKCESLNSLIACTGRIVPQNNFEPEKVGEVDRKNFFVGDMTYLFKNYCQEDTLVDYGCNSYFLKSEWLRAFWSVWPATFLSGEDIHLSATCKSVLGINTHVIQQTDNETCGNKKKVYGSDEVASWKQNKFISLRKEVLEYHILNNRWKPIQW
jgi:hypothetical protein